MDPFEILIDEHDHIVRALEVLDVVSGRLERGDPGAPEQMQTLVTFIRRYADACHHAKEEQVLFGVLVEHGLPREGGPIAVMLAEHAEGRALVARIQEHLDDPSSGPSADAVAAAREFSMLLQDHIRKENEVLFMLGRNVVPPSADADILAAYAKFEVATITPEQKAELLVSLDTLERELAAV